MAAARRLIAAVAVVAFTAAGSAGVASARVTISFGRVVSHTSPRYTSYAVDLAQVTGYQFWSQAPNAIGNAPVPVYDFSRPRLVALARALGPEYLRISGTAANATYYAVTGVPPPSPPHGYQMVLTRSQWDGVNRFAKALGLGILFGINDGPGPHDPVTGRWLPANALSLMRYTARMRDPVAALEFSNEPNLFALSGVPPTYTAADYVRDLKTFDDLRKRVMPRTQLVGPGSFYNNAGSETPYGAPLGPLATQVMPAVPGIYDALAFHEYPATSSRCARVGGGVPADPLAPAYLDGVLRAFQNLAALGRRYDPGAPIWDGEGASASCGGQQGYSDRFEATFWYLNAMGLLARHGLYTFIRQTLSGSDYGLINDQKLVPNPDYWAALLWHRLMGTAILAPQVAGAPSRLRVFAACARSGPGVTALALNLDARHPVTVSLPRGASQAPSVYLVTAPELLGTNVSLNSQPLRVSAQGTVPALNGRVVRSAALTLPPASYAFVVIPAAQAAGCKREPQTGRG
jgi:hypothetical protein